MHFRQKMVANPLKKMAMLAEVGELLLCPSHVMITLSDEQTDRKKQDEQKGYQKVLGARYRFICLQSVYCSDMTVLLSISPLSTI